MEQNQIQQYFKRVIHHDQVRYSMQRVPTIKSLEESTAECVYRSEKQGVLKQETKYINFQGEKNEKIYFIKIKNL